VKGASGDVVGMAAARALSRAILEVTGRSQSQHTIAVTADGTAWATQNVAVEAASHGTLSQDQVQAVAGLSTLAAGLAQMTLSLP